MSAYIVHRFTGEDAVSRMDSADEWKKYINSHKVAFTWGTQGPDTLFNDGKFLRLSDKRGEIGVYGGYMHREKTEELFHRLAEFLTEKKNSPEFPALAAFACGFVSHYCVDRRIHAYVYCKMRQYAGIVKTFKPNGVHMKLETDMDSAFYTERTGENVCSFQVEPEMKTAAEDIEAAEAVLLDLIEKVYDRKFPAGIVVKGIEYFYDKENFLFDEAGIRSKLFCRLKEIVHGEKGSYMLYCRPEKVSYDVLNLSHAAWVDPLEPEKVTKASVMDLLDAAADDTVEFIAELKHCVESGIPFVREGMGSFDSGSDTSAKPY